MSNELMVVMASASVAALLGGGAVAWWSGRSAAPASPDPVVTHQVTTDTEGAREKRATEVLTHQLRGAQEELARTVRHVGTLEDQVATYLRQYAQAKNTLKGEIRLKNSLKTELAAATAQIRALEARVQELEMERTAITGSRRQLSA